MCIYEPTRDTTHPVMCTMRLAVLLLFVLGMHAAGLAERYQFLARGLGGSGCFGVVDDENPVPAAALSLTNTLGVIGGITPAHIAIAPGPLHSADTHIITPTTPTTPAKAPPIATTITYDWDSAYKWNRSSHHMEEESVCGGGVRVSAGGWVADKAHLQNASHIDNKYTLGVLPNTTARISTHLCGQLDFGRRAWDVRFDGFGNIQAVLVLATIAPENGDNLDDAQTTTYSFDALDNARSALDNRSAQYSQSVRYDLSVTPDGIVAYAALFIQCLGMRVCDIADTHVRVGGYDLSPGWGAPPAPCLPHRLEQDAACGRNTRRDYNGHTDDVRIGQGERSVISGAIDTTPLVDSMLPPEIVYVLAGMLSIAATGVLVLIVSAYMTSR